MVESIHTQLPGAKIMLCGVNCPFAPVVETYTSTPSIMLQGYVKRRCIEYENKLKQLALSHSSYCTHIPLLPFFNYINSNNNFTVFLPNPRDPSNICKIYGDTVHPNLIGFGQMADVVFDAMCNLYFSN